MKIEEREKGGGKGEWKLGGGVGLKGGVFKEGGGGGGGWEEKLKREGGRGPRVEGDGIRRGGGEGRGKENEVRGGRGGKVGEGKRDWGGATNWNTRLGREKSTF